jgi:hypothetical protein
VTLDVTSLVEVVEGPRTIKFVDKTSFSVTIVSFGTGTMVDSEVMVLVRVADLKTSLWVMKAWL